MDSNTSTVPPKASSTVEESNTSQIDSAPAEESKLPSNPPSTAKTEKPPDLLPAVKETTQTEQSSSSATEKEKSTSRKTEKPSATEKEKPTLRTAEKPSSDTTKNPSWSTTATPSSTQATATLTKDARPTSPSSRLSAANKPSSSTMAASKPALGNVDHGHIETDATPASSSPDLITKMINKDKEGAAMYERFWLEIKDLSVEESTAKYRGTDCDAVSLHQGRNNWASMVAGHGIVGMYDTQEEAMKRALCAAMLIKQRMKKKEGWQGSTRDDDVTKKRKRDVTDTVDDKNKKQREFVAAAPPELFKKPAQGGKPAVPASKSDTKAPSARVHTLADARCAPESKSMSHHAPRQRPEPPRKYITNRSDRPVVDMTKTTTRPTVQQKPADKSRHTSSSAHQPQKREHNMPSARGPASKPLDLPCEMCDPVTGEVLQRFDNVSQAERVTRIARVVIAKACEEGGGTLQNIVFRYSRGGAPAGKQAAAAQKKDVAVQEVVGATKTAKAPPPSHHVATQGMGVSLKTAKRPYPSHDVAPQGMAVSAKSAKTKPPAPTTKTAKAPPPSRDVAAPGLAPPVKTIKAPRPSHDLAAQGIVASPFVKAQSSNTYAPLAAHVAPFDVSTLIPVRKKTRVPLRPKKLIEVVETATKSVIVCFRGTTDASRALGLNRKTVHTACEVYGTAHEYDLGNYTLRQAPLGSIPQAYEFGAHSEDFRPTSETHMQIMARWKRVFDGEKGQRENQQHEQEAGAQQPTGQSHQAAAALPAAASVADSSRSPFNNGPTDEQIRDECIMCQKKCVQVVFEPCHHSVLCRDCAEGSCRRFCPLCRTPITGRLHPNMMTLVRPRVYSAYKFM